MKMRISGACNSERPLGLAAGSLGHQEEMRTRLEEPWPGSGCDGGKVGEEEEGCGSASLPDPGASVSSRAPGGSGSFSWSHRVDTQGEVAVSESGV